jgi:replicative DNA helicase
MVELNGKPEGLPTGLNMLDGKIHGWNPGDLIILAARPSVGKTAFALNAMLAVIRQGIPSIMFSCEMQPKQIAERCFGILTSTRIESLRQGVNVAQEVENARRAQQIMQNFKGFAYDSDLTLSIPKIQDRARAHVATHGASLIIVDYVQRIRLGEKTGSIREEIVKVSGALQSLAKELKSPILTLSQIGRSGDDAPKMANMKESGSLEEDADVVIILDKMTDDRRDKAAAAFQISDDATKNKLIGIEVAKNRHGCTGGVIALFHKDIQRFSAITQTYEPEYIPTYNPKFIRDVSAPKTEQLDYFPDYDDGDDDTPF